MVLQSFMTELVVTHYKSTQILKFELKFNVFGIVLFNSHNVSHCGADSLWWLCNHANSSVMLMVLTSSWGAREASCSSEPSFCVLSLISFLVRSFVITAYKKTSFNTLESCQTSTSALQLFAKI